MAWTPARLSAASVRFAIIGDSQSCTPGPALNEPILSLAVQNVLDADPPVQFVISTGDLVSGRGWPPTMIDMLKQWRQVVAPWYAADFFGLKVYPAPGNHDQSARLVYTTVWQQVFPELPDNGPPAQRKLTYSFDVGPVHIAIVNTSAPTLSGNHLIYLDWLARDLATSAQPVKFVAGHEPAYSVTGHEGLNWNPASRDRFWAILAENNVQAYFCGHTHTYDHWIKDNVHQINAGSTGGCADSFTYLIVDAAETDTTVSVYDVPTNQLLEQYSLSDTDNVSRTFLPDPTPAQAVPPRLLNAFQQIPCALLVALLVPLLINARLITGRVRAKETADQRE